MSRPSRRAAFGLLAGGSALLLLAGCAARAPATSQAGPQQAWSGRLSLRIDSEPAQTFSAMFELRGTPQAGELILTTPIGSTLGRVHWVPGEALLSDGRSTRRFESLDALIETVTGAAIPVRALFGWLAGTQEAVPGWRPNLSQVGAGRLQATRESPAPQAELRLVFEPA